MSLRKNCKRAGVILKDKIHSCSLLSKNVISISLLQNVISKQKSKKTKDIPVTFFKEVSNSCKRENTFPQRQNSLVIAYKILYIHEPLLVTIYSKHLNLRKNVNAITRCFPPWLHKHIFPFLCSVFLSFILYIYREGANIFRKRTH